jgi:hypothetical protein
MSRKPNRYGWPMAKDRELIALAKTHSLETIADRLRRSPTSILNRAARLGLKITGLKAKGK